MFCLTSRCNIDLEKSTFTLKVYVNERTLNVLENRKQEKEKDNCYQVGMIKTCVKNQIQTPNSKTACYSSLTNPINDR